MQHPQPQGRLFFLLGGFLLLAGCIARVPAGSWQVEPEIQKIFEAGTLLPDHSYYHLGPLAAPDAVIAVDNRFTLRTQVWARVDMSTDLINSWLNWYRTENFGWSCPYYGGLILTPDGQRAGIWYSADTINIIRMPEPGVLEIYQPHSLNGRRCGEANDGDP